MEYYYYYDDRNQFIYFSEEFIDNNDLIYIGTSNNPNPRMAAAAFMQNGLVNTGFTLREWK